MAPTLAEKRECLTSCRFFRLGQDDERLDLQLRSFVRKRVRVLLRCVRNTCVKFAELCVRSVDCLLHQKFWVRCCAQSKLRIAKAFLTKTILRGSRPTECEVSAQTYNCPCFESSFRRSRERQTFEINKARIQRFNMEHRFLSVCFVFVLLVAVQSSKEKGEKFNQNCLKAVKFRFCLLVENVEPET